MLKQHLFIHTYTFNVFAMFFFLYFYISGMTVRVQIACSISFQDIYSVSINMHNNIPLVETATRSPGGHPLLCQYYKTH